MKANAAPLLWNELPIEAVDIIRKSFDAYKYTNGVFDPRILNDLVASGYDAHISFTLTTEEKVVRVQSISEQQKKRREILPEWELKIVDNQ